MLEPTHKRNMRIILAAVAFLGLAACGTESAEECLPMDFTGLTEDKCDPGGSWVGATITQCGDTQVLYWRERDLRYSSKDGVNWTCDPHVFCSIRDASKLIRGFCRR
jgi:hypothetical protein